MNQQNKDSGSAKEMPNLLLYLSQRQINNQCFVVSGPVSAGLDPSRTWLYYDKFPVLDLTLFRHPRPITQAYLRQDATDADTLRPELQSVGVSPRRREDPASLTTHASIVKNKHERDARPNSLQLSLTPAQPVLTLSPLAFALTLMRDVYAIWFELWSICLPSHTDVASGVVAVLEALARMTAQGVAPDEGIFRSALIICGRFGKKQEASAIFSTMTQRGVKPTPVTYAAYHMATLQQGHEGDEQPHFLRDSELIDITRESLSTTASSATDPYRKQVERFARLIRRSRRETVLWNSVRLAGFHRCVQCGFEMSEAGVMACWQLDQSKCHCPECNHAFQPTLRISCTIATRPARLKSIVCTHILHRPIEPMYCRYHIRLPLLPPAKLRREFLNSSRAFREDFLSASTFRVMHEVVYWNLLYQLSHPQNVWDLTFVVDLSMDELKKLHVRRLKRVLRNDDDDPAWLNHSLPPSVPLKVRTIEGSEGLRDRELAGLSAAQYFDYRSRPDVVDSDEESEIMISTGASACDFARTDVISSPSVSSIRSVTPLQTGSDPADTVNIEALTLTPARRGPDWLKEREITSFLQRHEIIKAMQFFLNCRIEARVQDNSVNKPTGELLGTPNHGRVPSKSVGSDVSTPQQIRSVNRVTRSAAEQSPKSRERPTRSTFQTSNYQDFSSDTPRSAKGSSSREVDDINHTSSPARKEPGYSTPSSHRPRLTLSSLPVMSSDSFTWMPIRDASPMSRLYDRCMFECFVMLALRYFDSYTAMSEMFTASINKLDGHHLSVLTTMDLAPSPTILTIEVTLGIKRRTSSKRRVDAEGSRISDALSKGESLIATTNNVSVGRTSSSPGISQRPHVVNLPHSISLTETSSQQMTGGMLDLVSPLPFTSPPVPVQMRRFEVPEEFAGSVSEFLQSDYPASPSRNSPTKGHTHERQSSSPANLESPNNKFKSNSASAPTRNQQTVTSTHPKRQKRLSQTRSAIGSNDDNKSPVAVRAPLRKKSLSHQSLEQAARFTADAESSSSPLDGADFVRVAGNEIRSGVERLIGFLRKPSASKSQSTNR